MQGRSSAALAPPFVEVGAGGSAHANAAEMEVFSLVNVLFVLHAISILAKTHLESRFRSFFSRSRASPKEETEEETELIDRKGVWPNYSACAQD